MIGIHILPHVLLIRSLLRHLVEFESISNMLIRAMPVKKYAISPLPHMKKMLTARGWIPIQGGMASPEYVEEFPNLKK